MAFARADKIPFRELESAADAFRDELGNVTGSECWVSEFCGALGFPTADRQMTHMIRRAETRKRLILASRVRRIKILEPQREVEFAALALVIRKGSNFDPLLCVLSPLFSHRPTMACRVCLLTTRSEANCVSPIRRSRST